MYCRYKSANIIGQDSKWADVEIHMSISGSTRCITVWFEMENEEYQLITKFLSSSTEFREWPSLVNTRDKKTNFRRKCAKYQLVSGNLHYMHKKHGIVRVIKTAEELTILQACHSSPTSGDLGVNKHTSHQGLAV